MSTFRTSGCTRAVGLEVDVDVDDAVEACHDEQDVVFERQRTCQQPGARAERDNGHARFMRKSQQLFRLARRSRVMRPEAARSSKRKVPRTRTGASPPLHEEASGRARAHSCATTVALSWSTSSPSTVSLHAYSLNAFPPEQHRVRRRRMTPLDMTRKRAFANYGRRCRVRDSPIVSRLPSRHVVASDLSAVSFSAAYLKPVRTNCRHGPYLAQALCGQSARGIARWGAARHAVWEVK